MLLKDKLIRIYVKEGDLLKILFNHFNAIKKFKARKSKLTCRKSITIRLNKYISCCHVLQYLVF